MTMDINALREMVKKKSTNVEVDNKKILETMNGGGGSKFKERLENELKLSLGKDGTSASVKVRLLPSPNIFGYLREHGAERFEGMTNVPYYENKSHWLSNPDAKKFYITKCSNRGWDDESCPACNLKKKAIMNHKTNPVYMNKFIQGPDKGGIMNVNTTESFLINVFVIDDKQNPENNGKVMFYSMSSGLFNKVVLPIITGDPEAGIEGIDVTNVLTGRDFFISVKKGSPYPDYISGSRFMDPTPFMQFFERKEKNGPATRANLVTVPYSTVEEFGALVENPEYLVDEGLIDPNTGEELMPVVYKLNKKFLDMLVNGLEIGERKFMPLENLSKMTDPAFDPNSYVGEEAVGKFTDLMASYGYDITGEPLGSGATLNNDSYGDFDEPVATKEQSASVEGIAKNDLSKETVSTTATSTVQKVSDEPTEIPKDENAKSADDMDFEGFF